VSVWCWAGPSVYVCVSYEECRLAVGLPDSECVVLGRSLCVCVIRGMLERVSVWCWAGPSVYVCVLYEECRVAVGLLERLSMCVSYEEC